MCKIRTQWVLWFFFVVPFFNVTTAADDEISFRVGEGTFTPAKPAAINYRDTSLVADVTYKSGRAFLHLQATGASNKTIPLHESIVQVDSIQRGTNDSLIVFGLVNWSTTLVEIVSISSGTIVDSFAALNPSVSTNMRFIAFVRFFPQHGGDQSEACYAVYDLNMKNFVEANRPGRDASELVPSLTEVGIKLYPVKDSEDKNSCRVAPSDVSLQHSMGSELFYWGNSGNRLIFADRTMSSLNIVAIDLTEGTINARIYESQLNSSGSFCQQQCWLSLLKAPQLDDKVISFSRMEHGKTSVKTVTVNPDTFVELSR